MSIELRAACSPGEVRVALLADGVLADYAIWRPGAPDGVGDLHRGRVLAHVPAMGGAFVALDGAEGFLPDTEGGAGQTEGAALLVRVTRAAQGGKGPRLTARLAPDEPAAPAGPAPALLRHGPGAVERLAALAADAPVAIDDPAVAAALRPVLGHRITLVPTAFDAALEDAVAALADPTVPLPGGGTMHIHPTPALTAIDLDAGSTSAARGSKTQAQTGLNRAALPELARQIRLRNLGGAIVVDLAGLSVRRRAALGPALAAALAEDPLHPRFLGFTALGLAEILRPRLHPPLHELLASPHAAGLAALRRLEAEQTTTRLTLRAAPAIIAALQADPTALADFTRRTGHPPNLRADPTLPNCVIARA
jgi:Ribonuclease G/E